MLLKRTTFLMLAVVAAWPAGSFAQRQAAVEAVTTNDKTALTRQLKINRDALMLGPGEQQRIDAAIVLLPSKEKAAREILLLALKDEKNGPARAAVCKALSQSRSWSRSIKNKEDFVEPLFAILKGQDKEQAKLAAGALLVFEYHTIDRYLKKIISSDEPDYRAILNAIYALRLRPEREAIFELIRLREHSDKAIAATAEKELQRLLGIPAGTDKQTWDGVLKELQRKNRYEFMRDRLVRQEMEVNRLKGELNRCQKAYEVALDEVYKTKSPEEGARGAFLLTHLGSEWPAVRLWALEKVRQWRLSGKTLPTGLGASLGKLVSDPDGEVRLQTARLLRQMGDSNLAGQLVGQLKAEKDDDVRIELLGALGEACYTALALKPDEKAAEEITAVRKLALEVAGGYIADTDKPAKVGKVQKAAGVIRKLLEQEGLGKDEAGKYLRLLAGRYDQEKRKEDGFLRGELLGAMAALCGGTVDCRADAARLFKPLFLEALEDNANSGRQAAATGLINIDKSAALAVLKEKGVTNDQSLAVRNMVIELAGTVGGKEDLEWLAAKLAANGENEAAWGAMRKIFAQCKAAVLAEWADKFRSTTNPGQAGAEMLLYLLQTAQEKAVKENNFEVLKQARNELGDLCRAQGKFKEAARYYGMLLEMIQPGKEQDDILGKLLEVNLQAGEVAAVKNLMQNRLQASGDLGPDDIIVRKLGEYFAKAGATNQSRAVLEAFLSIKNEGSRPMWTAQLQQWRQQVRSGPGQSKSGATAGQEGQ